MWVCKCMKGCSDLSNAFSGFIKKIAWTLSLILSRRCFSFIDMYVFNYACICVMKSTGSWCMVFLNALLNWFRMCVHQG